MLYICRIKNPLSDLHPRRGYRNFP